jgi:hypothetical protein
MGQRGIAVIKWRGSFAVAKIVVQSSDPTATVAVLPRRKGPLVSLSIPASEVEMKLCPVFLRGDQLNDDLKTFLEG